MSKKLQSNNTSGHIGVYFHKRYKKWQAVIFVNKKRIFLGMYADINDAIKARELAESKYGHSPNHGKEA